MYSKEEAGGTDPEGIPRKSHCGRDWMRASILGAYLFPEIALVSMQKKDHSGGIGGYAPSLGLTM